MRALVVSAPNEFAVLDVERPAPGASFGYLRGRPRRDGRDDWRDGVARKTVWDDEMPTA